MMNYTAGFTAPLETSAIDTLPNLLSYKDNQRKEQPTSHQAANLIERTEAKHTSLLLLLTPKPIEN